MGPCSPKNTQKGEMERESREGDLDNRSVLSNRVLSGKPYLTPTRRSSITRAVTLQGPSRAPKAVGPFCTVLPNVGVQRLSSKSGQFGGYESAACLAHLG